MSLADDIEHLPEHYQDQDRLLIALIDNPLYETPMDLKTFVGEPLWASPTGNNSRRWSGHGERQVTLIKVGRVNVTLRIGGREEVYRLCESNRPNATRIELTNGHNAGYCLYRDQHHWQSHQLKNYYADQVRRELNKTRPPQLKLRDWVKIGDLLGVERPL